MNMNFGTFKIAAYSNIVTNTVKATAKGVKIMFITILTEMTKCKRHTICKCKVFC